MFFVSKDILDTETAKNVFKKEAMDRSIVKDRKQQFIESHKAEQKTLFDKRKLERFALAQESQQSYIEKYNNTQSDVLSRLEQMPPEKRRNLAVSKSSILNSVCNTQDNLWNYYTKLAPKQINKNFTPLAVKLEEECVIRIRDKIVKGEKVLEDELALRNKKIRSKYEKSKIRREHRKDYFEKFTSQGTKDSGRNKRALDTYAILFKGLGRTVRVNQQVG
jgi:hypothetical protein